MALDPFFQQGMNAWGDRVKAQEGRARSLGAMVDAGQIKDLLQRTGHRQKMSEGEQTGQFNIANTLAGMGILSTRGAKEADGQPTAVTNDLTNVMNAERFGRNLSRIGAGAAPLAEQTGQFIDDPVSALKGLGSTFTRKKPGAETRAKLVQPYQGKKAKSVKYNQMMINGKPVQGLMQTVTEDVEAKGKATTPDAAAQNITRLYMDLQGKGWERKGDVTNVVEGQSRKTGGRLYQVTYTNGTTETVDESGKVLKTVGPIPNAPL